MTRSVGQDRFADHAWRALATCDLAPPQAGEACVVLFDTAQWSAFENEACEWLDAAERDRAARFRFEPDRCSYVLAHALWRAVLAWSLACDAREVPLRFLPSGQPCLAGTPLTTSLSHSGPVALVAVGAVGMLGVDLERWPPRISLDDLLPAICTPDESDMLRALPPVRRERALLQLWTRKEALLKAFGTGLAQAPATFGAALGEPVRSPSDPAGPPCRVYDLALPGDRLGALAASPELRRYRLHLSAVDDRFSGPDDVRTPPEVVET
jgi:4'-phosphopantetheinyl transferase